MPEPDMHSSVDRQARDAAVQILRGFIAGKVDNFDFEAAMPDTRDPAITALWHFAWYFYDDFNRHRLAGRFKLHPTERREFLRWVLFLDSDDPYVWPAKPSDPYRALESILPWQRRRARNFLKAGQFESYPFATRRREKTALRHPRRLSGLRRT